VYPGIGWLILREESDLYPDWCARTRTTWARPVTPSPELLDRVGDRTRALLQPRAIRRSGCTYMMRNMQTNAHALAAKLVALVRL
jgi:hypothetical protein